MVKIFAALITMFACLFGAPDAHAAAVDRAPAAFGISGSYKLVRITRVGDITRELTDATKTAASADAPRMVTLPAGNLTLTTQIRVANHVYLVAEPNTTVVLKGSTGQILWFNGVSGGVYGGSWDASRKSANVFSTKSSAVRLSNLTVRNATKNGIATYAKSTLTMTDVTSTGNVKDGVYSEASTVNATRVRATKNRRNGLQLSAKSVGTITDSTLDSNGLAVTGTTTGKVGHGLGIASSRASVSRTTMSSNKVCGVSMTGSVSASLTRVTLSSNGRHGMGSTPGVKASLTDSVVAGNRYNGVLASGAGTQLQLTGVTITGTSRFGLSVPSKGSATLQRSTITTSGRSNISVSGRGNLTIEGGNRVAGGRSDGITVTGKAKLTVSGDDNRIGTNAGNGLVISGKGTTGRIARPVQFEANRKHGIMVKVKGRLATVANSFARNKGTTIHKQSGGKVTKIA